MKQFVQGKQLEKNRAVYYRTLLTLLTRLCYTSKTLVVYQNKVLYTTFITVVFMIEKFENSLNTQK